jgi:transposase InsO family protein
MSRATAYRLFARYRQEGWEGLRDRPPVAKRCPHRLSAQAEAQIVALRRRTGWGPRALSSALGRPASTVWRVLVRHGESRAQRAPRPPVSRYEYAAPGELVHLDAKKLGRFWQIGKRVLFDGVQRNKHAGWQHAHVAVDDHSRWGMVELRPAEDAATCTAFLASVISAYADRGIAIRRVMTDNGSGYRSRRFRALLADHDIHHIRTKPYTPRTNGKAEAFIRILQREWAYAYIYPSSAHRARALPGWIRRYNHHRPHGGIGGHPPVSRISHAARSNI